MNIFKQIFLSFYKDKNIVKLSEEDVNLLREYFKDETTFPLEGKKAKTITLINSRQDYKRRIFVLEKQGNTELPWRGNSPLPF